MRLFARDLATPDQTTGVFRLHLRPGWNLVSLPIAPGPNARGGSSLGLAFPGPLWSWRSDLGRYEKLREWTPLSGVWVYSDTDSDVRISGTLPASTTVHLSAGWNLVGPASPMGLPEADPIVPPVWGWSTERETFSKTPRLLPGKGYWVYCTGNSSPVPLGQADRDFDGDGLLDVWEENWNADWRVPDTDQDGLTDYEEVYVYHTRPDQSDTDGDGMLDGFEVRYGLSPLDPSDAQEDPDADGLSNAVEAALGFNPFAVDVGNPQVRFSRGTSRVSETAGTAFVAVQLTALPSLGHIVRVQVEIESGTAAPNEDFTVESPILLELDRSDPLARVPVHILADGVFEPDETIVFRITSVSGAQTGLPYRHTMTIVNGLGSELDADADGLPDAWERRFFGSLAQSAQDDYDGDGLSNLEEYESGMTPDIGFQRVDPAAMGLRVLGVVK